MDKTKSSKIFSVLQNFGPTMMMAIAIIPLGGMLLGIGVFMQQADIMEAVPFLASAPVFAFSSFIRSVGNMIIGNLAILFAIAVAEGLSDHDGAGAFAAVVSYLTMNTVIGTVLNIDADALASSSLYTTSLGMNTLQMGVFGGICVGIMVGILYKKFKNTKLPAAISFFQGKRFVVIVSVFGAMILGVIFCLIWPPIQNGIISLSGTVADTTNPVALYIYGLVNRLLIPFGLHNLWYPIFYFQTGTWVNEAGQTIVGDLNIYLAQLQEGSTITHGLTSGGCYLFPGFCIAAAFAIANCAKPENRKKTLGLFMGGIGVIALTGITEPIEFVFMWTCFPLYIIHSFFMALSFPILCLLDIHVGSTFCGGLMDWIVYGVMQGSPGWIWIIPLNVIVGVIYYFIFKFLITKFKFKTPGREDEVVVMAEEYKDEDVLAAAIIKELGGKENIRKLDACATRIRATVLDKSIVDKNAFKTLGANGVMQNGNDFQIIYGTEAAYIKENMKAIIDGKTLSKEQRALSRKKIADVTDEEIVIPINGELLTLQEVPDKIFAEEMMGTGFAINPSDGIVVSPVNGTIDNIFPTKHAIGIVSDQGKEIMIHLGVDTVKLEGEPFEVLVKTGEIVEVGQKIVKMDLDFISQKAPSAISSIIFTNMPEYKVELCKKGKVKAKDKDFMHFVAREDV